MLAKAGLPAQGTRQMYEALFFCKIIWSFPLRSLQRTLFLLLFSGKRTFLKSIFSEKVALQIVNSYTKSNSRFFQLTTLWRVDVRQLECCRIVYDKILNFEQSNENFFSEFPNATDSIPCNIFCNFQGKTSTSLLDDPHRI